jgi:hypothetical protein
MLKKSCKVLGIFAVVALAHPALADEDTTGRPVVRGTGSIGGMVGESAGSGEGGFVLEAQSQGDQRPGGTFGITRYGHDYLRLEIGGRSEGGVGLGIAGGGMSGSQLVGVRGDQNVMLHIGAEPFNLQFNAHSSDAREDFIEWMPMGSAGVQVAADTCRAIALLRGGAAIGTLGNGGARGAWGGGAYLTCPAVQVAGEITRIESDNKPVDVAAVNARLNLASHNLSLGVLAEAITTRRDGTSPAIFSTPGEGDNSERRLFLMVGGAF